MNVAAGPDLAAAVTNAGGLGVIGGLGYTPEQLRKIIKKVKSALNDKNAPFGVDLLLPQVGGNARATNSDYTKGQLAELIDVVIDEKAKLFVSAVGVPPAFAVEKLHKAGIPIMNMVGAPKHAIKACEAGVDLICAQGGEGGGHTGEVATSILIPKVVDVVRERGFVSKLTGKPVMVVAAGGIFDGRGLAASLCYGAEGVWVGTRFVMAKEAGAPPRHQQAIMNADYHDTMRTVIYTGRPMRIIKNPYAQNWETERSEQIRELTAKGVVPIYHDIEEITKDGDDVDPDLVIQAQPLLSGQVAGALTDVKPAKEIVDDMVSGAVKVLGGASTWVKSKGKL
ncbi:NPD-domain-containing protein [Gonapodya prolifera JEL478]|uniref:NPD-domain-containing protein n=1 Tax=Gonapodya prolifera (strain JEL478) TaxID=1344416 RepID=A0A139ANV8_GONPJ|nr:NPD-domain-containing protein [Gonapodya prolifera JEL478]|eukprot:KXS18441.1 NPD-domain-containing protein [Gonapodya prolifera JEL478]